MNKVEMKLLSTTAEILIHKGIPAFMDFIRSLHSTNKQVPSIEDIEKAKGELDSRLYFE